MKNGSSSEFIKHDVVSQCYYFQIGKLSYVTMGFQAHFAGLLTQLIPVKISLEGYPFRNSLVPHGWLSRRLDCSSVSLYGVVSKFKYRNLNLNLRVWYRCKQKCLKYEVEPYMHNRQTYGLSKIVTRKLTRVFFCQILMCTDIQRS